MSKGKQKGMEIDDEEKINLIKENLTCSVLKKNYIDDPTIILGYPIVRSSSKFNPNKIELYPIPEMLTYEGFLSEINNQQQKLDLYFDTHFKSSGDEEYNCWIPVYINQEHYEKNKTHILNSFSIIKFGNEGKKEYDFKPEQIFEILPIVLNKMIIGMFTGKTQISSAFIKSYFQYVLLFKKLCDDFEDENLAFMNKKLSLIFDNEYKIDKKIIPDIGNFLMILFFCNKDTHEEEMKKMWDCLFEEFIIRTMFWAFHSDENKQKMKKIVLKTKNNETYMKRFEEQPNFRMIFIDKFNTDLNRLNLFDQIVAIISQDKKYTESIIVGKDSIKEQIIKDMAKNFKKLFCGCGDESKNQIKKIINDNLDFSDYFWELKDDMYDNLEVDKILKNDNIKNKDEIIENLFESQRGNKLLIITFFAQKKVEEKGFLEELEKNYGIFLEVDDFIEEMNKKIEEIKSFKQLLEYVGSDYGKDKTDMEIIIEAYEKAKEKDYINSTNARRNVNNINNINVRNNYRRVNYNNLGIRQGLFSRGRGRGRGRGRDRGFGYRGRGRDRGRGNNRGRRFDKNEIRSRSRSRSRSGSKSN